MGLFKNHSLKDYRFCAKSNQWLIHFAVITPHWHGASLVPMWTLGPGMGVGQWMSFRDSP
jgi:hypothetical protein